MADKQRSTRLKQPEQTKSLTKVEPKDFGKDHWSLLAYIKTRCVDYGGRLDIKHMRTKNPALQSANQVFGPQAWQPEYGTRLAGYWNEDGSTNPDRRLDNHDDHDCQEDLEDAGYIVNTGTGLHPAVKLTKLGLAVAAQVDAHKANGSVFASFKLGTQVTDLLATDPDTKKDGPECYEVITIEGDENGQFAR